MRRRRSEQGEREVVSIVYLIKGIPTHLMDALGFCYIVYEGENRTLFGSVRSWAGESEIGFCRQRLQGAVVDLAALCARKVVAVHGSPYEWMAARNVKGTETGSVWYLNLEKSSDPDPEPIVRPEVIAGVGLHEAAIEQTRSIARNVSGKLAANKQYCNNCGVYDYNWDGKALKNVWVMVEGETADMEKPVDIESKIWGMDAGFDVQNDVYNNLGVFVSYRKGDYDLNGKGKGLRSNIGSDIDIDSYLAGLYYRYDKANNYVFASVYGGMQKADIKTDDGIAKMSTDGVEIGANVEVGRTIKLTKTMTITPMAGVYYNQIDFDSATDNVGKRYKWDTIKHVEVEAGVKLAKDFGVGNVYIKPSVIQNITGDDKVSITGLNTQTTYHDDTLGRIELGGRYGMTDNLTGYISGKYTFGSNYEAYTGTVGLSYSW